MKMEKVIENHFGGRYNKYYMAKDFTYLDLVGMIKESEIELLFVDVDEGVERDMQSVSRHYGLEEFIDLSGYIESAAYDIKHLGFTFVGKFRDQTVIISTSANDDPLIALTSNEELEIEDILPIGEDK